MSACVSNPALINSAPPSLSLAVNEMVEVCVLGESRGRESEQKSIWEHSYTRDDLFYVRALGEERAQAGST